MGDGHTEYSARDVAMAVRRLDLMMSQMHLEMCERLGLSAGELLALAHLSVAGPLGPTELTHRLHMTTGAMTAMLDRLAERDYVVREPHATDRRRSWCGSPRRAATGSSRTSTGWRTRSSPSPESSIAEQRRTVAEYIEHISGALSPPAQPDGNGG